MKETANEMRGRVVVVTGASAGVGRATAREFGRRGAFVGLVARNVKRLEVAKNEIEKSGGRAIVLPTDVADPYQVEAAAERVEAEFGHIEVWVNNSMTTIFAPFLEIKPEEYKRATEVTYLGCVYGTMSALKRMKRRNRGTIVQVGSALAYRSIPLQSAYCGAKHAVVGFTDSIRSELIHERSKVHLTVVHLPGLNTPQFSWCRTRLPRHPQPVPPVYQPEVAAEAIVWASTHERREVWVGLSTYEAIIGQRIAPGFADRYLAKHAVEGQETSEPVSSNRPDNLFETVGGTEYSAHGIFDREARGWSVTNSLVLNPPASQLLLSLGFISTGLALLGWRKKSG